MKKSAITVLKIWIKDQATLTNVPNNDQQKKKVKETLKKNNAIEYKYNWVE